MQFIFLNFRTNLTLVLSRLFVFMLVFGIVLAQTPTPSVQARAGEPKLILEKAIEGGVTTAQVGDTIRYRIRLECSSLIDPCGELVITDVLQAGLTYLPPPNSSVPAGFTITEGPVGTITIRKTDNLLLDGSQYDAVIAVKVNYDLRPLPATINNTINGTIDPPGPIVLQNALPASAPPITISGLNPNWGLTKTLYSPSINPTVDTDVTYQINLCPVTVSGNVPLQNIVITDTLPAGAIFRSASNGGINAAGVVTWNIAGPVTPPSCVTRYVTVLYPAASFPIGPNVSNNASATGSYLDSSGGICTVGCVGITPTVITHPIDVIKAVPSYSKNDVGDPVGYSGTARFVLSLNTNGTNYPSNNVMLIDNLPPQLQVTEITSGAWSAAFDYVRAYVDYSTNNASTWTTLAGPFSYNTGGTYIVPVANITNVRWRFEYDSDRALPFDVGTTQPGLPYTWSFTSNPEIRVKPRAVAVNTDPPVVVSLPVAVNGATYNNCAQVSRVDNTGAKLDPCVVEDMTVRGNFVSLRTSKGETPGEPWDDLYDPNITTFTSDFNILPGDTLKYTVTVDMTERSSAPLIDPTILDTLPADMVFVRNGTATLDGAAVAQPLFTQVGQDLKWTWDTLLGGPGLTIPTQALGSHLLQVEFYARIPRGQTPGMRTNNLYVTTDSVDVLCEIGTQSTDTGSIDGDGNTTEAACKTTDTYIVERSAALRGEKWIRSTDPSNSVVINSTTLLPDATCPNGLAVGLGSSANNFTRFPCIAQAFPENAFSNNRFTPPPPAINLELDDFEYNLRVFNDGNVPMMKYVLYDILPYYGDKGSGGTLANSARNSEFHPALRGPVQFISGPAGLSGADFTIEYNLTSNPCRPEVFNLTSGAIPPGCDNTWSTTWSALARSYRIRLNTGSLIQPSSTSSEVRFGVPMSIPAEADPIGAYNNDDPQSKEIAWNSFSHVGSYTDISSVVKDLLASEPRKVGITIPEVMSVGNRVWRDSDNSGTINAPDDINPGIANVVVNIYRDADNNGIADGPAIASTITDSKGYYLFSNIPYSATPAQNRYIIGIPASNFAPDPDGAGPLVDGPLYTLHSSTGTPASATYTNPLTNTVDSADDGIDPTIPPIPSTEVFSAAFTLQPTTEPTGETDISTNPRDGPIATSRGVNGERDYNSDLTIDFGFFGGSSIPFSIGNHVWFDNGAGVGAAINDGIRQGTEPPVVGALVYIYRDGNANGIPEAGERMTSRSDITDANGFYLFDNLDPGTYFIQIAPTNFAADPDGAGPLLAGPLAGWYSSQPTGTETLGVNGGSTTADIDSDDNGVNDNTPEARGIFSGAVVITRGTNETLLETHLSSDISVAAGFNPTAGDGAGHIGRFGETDATSNMTIDFGFIPPMSLGNRVWFDNGAGETTFRAGFNNGVMDGTEVGVNGVSVELWRDTNGTAGLQLAGDTFIRATTTDALGYYLFDYLQPGNNYYIHIPDDNFGNVGVGDLVPGDPLANYLSSFDWTAPADNSTDKNDNGVDNAAPAANGITSQVIVMTYNTEPLTPTNETDLSLDTATYGTNNVGRFGQLDNNSNLTMDFGFIRAPHSLGNRLWFDINNNRQIDAGELPVEGARVSLYRDSDNNGIPDDVNGDTLFNASDALAFDITDAAVAGIGGGYYLFDNLPAGRYLVGVDYTNFQTGNVLAEYASSTGTDTTTDNRDNGIDRTAPADATASPYGIISANVNLTGLTPTGETSLSTDTGSAPGFNPTTDDGPNSRGRFGETDDASNLQIDFGFYKFMSLGNRVFRDDGGTTGILNDGIMNGDELPFANVRVELYLDNGNNIFGAGDTLLNFDVTDAGGYYLFDHLVPGNYFVRIPATNFTGAGILRGWYNSTPTFATNVDRDDNGVNNAHPNINGITSGLVTLALDTEPTGETDLSADTGSALGNDPTTGDGPNSRGRWNESDDNSNLMVDFGFIPPLSLGNRVWIDDGATSATTFLLSQFNNGVMDGTEVGRANVALNLYFDANNDGDYLDTVDGIAESAVYQTTSTDVNGYYLFDGLQQGRYYVQVAPSNFGAGNPLVNYLSSTGVTNNETGDVNDNGQDSPTYLVNGIRSMDFVLGYNGEPSLEADIPAATAPNITAYGPNLRGRFGETDPSSNLTLDLGFMQPHSIGNRIWRDSDNSGTINAPDDVNPGIAGVTVNLYADVDTIDAGNDGIPDNLTIIATTTTDSAGYYLFDNLPAGNFIVGIPASNFATSTDPLYTLRSSTGTPSVVTYTKPIDSNPDSSDHGIDSAAVPPTPSTAVYSPIIPLANNEAIGEALPANTPANQTAYGTNLRGRYGETDLTSDLTVDFGFFGGSDVPFSIGNHIWFDNGAGANLNNGIRDAGELPVAGARVYLYRDGNANGIPEGGERLPNRSDITDASGFYLFDNLDPGTYFVQVDSTNFAPGGSLAGWFSSQPTGTETLGVNGGSTTADIDNDDNGVNTDNPDAQGVFSGAVVLIRGTNEPAGETHLSADVSIAPGFDPTAGDGAGHIGRFGETDVTSNMTIDFGFIPPMSLGNRVWFDNGAGEATFRAGYNNAIQDGTEVGVNGVRVELWRDTNGTAGLQLAGDTFIRATTTDALGYYLFDYLQPGNNYYIHIPDDNFGNVGVGDLVAGDPLLNYLSSSDLTAPADNAVDKNDNGVDNATPAINGITSQVIAMTYGTEPTTLAPINETDIPANTPANILAYGTNLRGRFNQADNDSNLTMDFGFILAPHSLGNRLWFDTGVGVGGVANDRIINGTEPPVVGARVSLYRDSNNNGVPDDVNGDTLFNASDALAFDVTDAGGYYLFDNLPAGRYIVGVDYTNFQTGNVLDEYASSTATTVGTDNRDNGIDRPAPADATASPHGVISASVNLTGLSPTGELAANSSTDTGSAPGFNPTTDDGPNSRGRFGEADNASNLLIDFGFYKFMSLGNRIFRDDGGTTGILNNGIMDGDELPFANVRVDLYRDTNNNGVLNIGAGDTFLNFDTTDAGGYYLFDRLDPGNYFVHIPASNFIISGAGALRGWTNSTPTGTETVGIAGNPYTPNTDRDDNGINNTHLEVNGIASGLITLALDTEPTGETELSASTGYVITNSPTAGDGPNSRGRWNESDDNSNLTVDFGFIPPLSLGNRVWIDDGSTAGGLVISQFNDGIMNGTEAGRANVALNLYFDANNDGDYLDTVDGVAETTAYRTTTTDSAGYYLFDGLPQGRFYVQIASSNFGAGNALENLVTSTNVTNNETGDINDNGQDDTVYLVNGIRSMDFILGYNTEATLEADIPAATAPNIAAYGPNLRGRFGESDASSNLTLDFGFMSPRSLGNRIWLDDGGTTGIANNGILDGDEAGINGVTVSLYADNDGNGIPDGVAILTTTTSAGTTGAGYYLFSSFPAGRYVVGVDSSNFTTVLLDMASSIDLAGHPVDADVDKYDHGIDRTVPSTSGILSPSIDLRNPPSETIGETDLSGRPVDGPVGESRGTHNEADNQSDLTVDFGFYYPFSIGNRVFRDDGGTTGIPDNGIMDGDELPVAGVRVELYRDTNGTPGLQVATDTLVRFDTTDVSVAGLGGGYYLFDGLNPGEYYIHIPAVNFTGASPLTGYNNSTPTFSADIDRDDNGINNARPDLNGISSGAIILSKDGELTGETDLSGNTITTAGNSPTAGDGPLSRGRYGESDDNSNLTVDFGFLQKVAIGNTVWLDNGAGAGVANNGILDGTEAGIASVVVELYRDGIDTIGTPFRTTTTDANGRYVFDNLLPGKYFVFIPTTEFGAGKPLVNLLSSTDPTVPVTSETADQNADENGIDQPIPAATGIRSMVYDLQPNTEPTAEPQPNYTGSLDDNNVNFTADFGFTELVALGNRVWFDTGTGVGGIANNGILDGTEAGVNGIIVELYNATTGLKVAVGPDGILGTADDATGDVVTSGGGYYKFDMLLPGTYYVNIPATEFASGKPLFGYVSTIGNGAVNNDSDQNADENGIDGTTLNPPTTAGIHTPNYTLIPNTEPIADNDTNYGGGLDDDNVNLTADFGFVQLVAIGNRVWFDIGSGVGGVPNDGILNGSEAGADGVTVELFNATTGLKVATGPDGIPGTADDATGDVVTSGGGYYRFDNLVPGDYYIHIPASMFDATLPSPLQGFLSSTGAGNNETSDETVTVLNPTADENGIDVANLEVNGISSHVFTLTPNTETVNDNQTSYNGYLDNDNVNFTADFGFLNIVAIGNRVWFDNGIGGGTANDGIQNGTEPGVNGVKVELYLSTQTPGTDTPVSTTTTDLTGYYVFDNLLAGTYVIYIPASNFGAGQPLFGYYSSAGNGTDETSDQSVDENGIDQPNPATTGITSTPYTLSANTEPTTTDNDTGYTGVLDDNDVNFTADFGFVQKYALGNRVWFDTNDNATMDTGEIGINGVLVELYRVGQTPGTDTPIATSTTINGGYYLFDNIYPGDYIVAISRDNFIENGANDKLVGYWSSLTSMGLAGTTTETAAPSPNSNGSDGLPNTSDDDVDQDDNGTRQASGYVLSLPVTIGPNGNTEPTDETDLNGGSQGSQPNDRANMKVDFGFYKVSVGDLIFSDGVKDGTYVPADDAVLSGILVHLFASNGTSEIITGADGILGTADDTLGPDGVVGGGDDNTGGMYTNAGGKYQFGGLPLGTYIITVDSPVGTSSTIDNGSPAMQSDNDIPADNLNNNDNGDGIIGGPVSSAPVTLTPGVISTNNIVTNSDGSTHNPTLDFGFIPAFSLGNRIWFDTDNNGKIDFNNSGHLTDPTYREVGINGVTIEVYAADASGNPTGAALDIDTTVANGAENGYYLFNPLPAGNYVVVIPASNFTTGVLKGYWSSGVSRNADGSLTEIASPDPDNGVSSDIDSDDNGMHRFGIGDVISKPVTLGPNPTEPTAETDNGPLGQGQPDNRANMTVDFGFYTIDIGNQIWNDADNSGTINGAEVGFGGVDVELWTADGLTMLAATTTPPGGVYGFSGQPQGDYIVRIPAIEFNAGGTLENYTSSTGTNSITPPVALGPYEPAPDADVNTTDSDDNGSEKGGTLGLGGYIQSEAVTLSPTSESTYNNANGGTSESRVDFGVFYQVIHEPIIGVAKDLISSTEVSPGTYQVVYDILVSNMGDVPLNAVQVTDNLSATFTAPTTATFQSISAVGLTVNPAYSGSGNLLAGTDSLAVGASGTIRLVVNVIPYAAGPFQNTAIASGTNPFGGAVITDRSQNGKDPDPDKDGNPTNNNVPTPVTFGPALFDPPIGIKTFDDSGLPLLKWTMVWINSTNIAAVNARVSDPIPPGTTYSATGTPSGFPVPGAAPAGSTNIGVACSSPTVATTTTLCYYEGPTAANPLGRIVWEGVLGPDFGHTTTAAAVNPLFITFNVSVPAGVTTAYNRATIDTDLNGNGIFDPVEIVVADSQAIWVMLQQPEGQLNGRERRKASSLPHTGFAPGMVTTLPKQPADKAYLDTGGVRLEIPRLGINTSIVGIPQADDGAWDVSWLWQQSGWLQGTAYPTLAGNSVITGHVYLPNGKPGPFVDVNKLAYGDKIIIHANGQKYIYEVRENKTVKPNDVSVLKNEAKAWVTLITCLGYNESTNTYASRVAVKAVLTTVEAEKTSTTSSGQ